MNTCTGSTQMTPCSCGLYHHYQPTSFCNLFPTTTYDQQMCPYASSSSVVDCTLSLGTPSTRLTNDNGYEKPQHEKRRSGSSSWWNILQSSSTQHSAAPPARRAGYGDAFSGGNGSSGSDSLFSRRCANCDATSTSLWRNGPRGPKSLCNACGIRYKKEERRANAAAASLVTSGGSDATSSEGYHHQYAMNGGQWVNDYSQSTHKLSSCYSTAASNEYMFMDHVDDRDSTFHSWRLNVTDRPGFVHDFNY